MTAKDIGDIPADLWPIDDPTPTINKLREIIIDLLGRVEELERKGRTLYGI